MAGQHSKHPAARTTPKAKPTLRRKAKDAKPQPARKAKAEPIEPAELSKRERDRRDRPPKPKRHRPDVLWNWFDLILISVTLVLAFFVSGNVMGSALAQLLPGTGQATLRLVLVLLFYLIEILVVAYIAHRHSFRFMTLYRLRSTDYTELEPPLEWVARVTTSTLLVVGFLVLTLGLGILWSYLTTTLGWIPGSINDLLTMFGSSPASIVLAVLCVVVLAPFIEEIIFRGVFVSTLEMTMPAWAAVLVTAVVFALYHASVWAFIPHVILACALGYLAVTRKTLWPAILLHALYNAALMAAAFYLSL